MNLKAGKLVAFPTETVHFFPSSSSLPLKQICKVYGLGANALDVCALSSIFTAKGRPKSDPLIVHVNSVDKAVELVDLDEKSLAVYRFLGGTFWPGPLTIVAKAAPVIPDLVTSGTGFVGVRCPNNPIARSLIDLSSLPIAAPSANKFCHVSPTKAEHVCAVFAAGSLSKSRT